MKKKEPEYVAQTLAWCNERRKEQGKEPLSKMPKGEIADPESCPCGKAANVFVSDKIWLDGNNEERPLPGPVIEFVEDFDMGLLPQYIA